MPSCLNWRCPPNAHHTAPHLNVDSHAGCEKYIYCYRAARQLQWLQRKKSWSSLAIHLALAACELRKYQDVIAIQPQTVDITLADFFFHWTSASGQSRSAVSVSRAAMGGIKNREEKKKKSYERSMSCTQCLWRVDKFLAAVSHWKTFCWQETLVHSSSSRP